MKFYILNGDHLISYGSCLSNNLPELKDGEELFEGDIEAPLSQCPKANYRWNVKTLVWDDCRTQEQKEYDEIFDVQCNRYANYPPLHDFADAMYWASKGDESKLEIYLAKCDEVKNRFPKPNK